MSSRGTTSAFLVDQRKGWHQITRVEWTYEDREPESQWSSEKNRAPLDMIDKYVEGISWEYDGWKVVHRQFNLVAGELLDSALEKIRRGKVPSDDTEDWLRNAWSIASSLWDDLLRSERSTRKERRDTKAKPRKNDDPVTLPWRKREPAHGFHLGVDYSQWTTVSREEIDTVIDRYLAFGLDSPSFEWICTDILIYADVRNFGESIKQRAPVSVTSPLGMNYAYFFSGGNLERMHWVNFKLGLGWLAAKLAFWIGLPVLAGMHYWSQGRHDEVLIGATGWIVLLVVWPLVRKVLGIGSSAERFRKHFKQSVKLFGKMSAAYSQVKLDNPPGVIRRALEKVSEEGVHWDGRAMSLLTKAEMRDPVCWHKDGHKMWFPPMSLKIAERLKQAYGRQKKAGIEMKEPDFDEAS